MGDDSRDVFDKALDYGLPVAGAAVGGAVGSRLAKRLYRGKFRLRGGHGEGFFTQGVTGGKSEIGRGWVSVDSPLGSKLRGRRAGDTVNVKTPTGGVRQYKVIEASDNGFLLRPLVIGTAAAGAAGGAYANQKRRKK